MAKKRAGKTVKATKLQKRSKFAALFLAVSCVLFVVGLFLTKSWVTAWPEYKDKDFSFKYPAGWYIAHYSFGSGDASKFTTRVAPQPQYYTSKDGYSVVDFGKVSFQSTIDVYDKNDTHDIQQINSLNEKITKKHYIKIGSGRFLFANTYYFNYVVMDKNLIYDINGSSDIVEGTNFVERKIEFFEGFLAALSFK